MKLGFFVRLLEQIAILVSERGRKLANVEQVVRSSRNPSRPVHGQLSAGDDAAQMHVPQELLAPRVKDRRDPRSGAELSGRKVLQRRRSRLEEQGVDQSVVTGDQGIQVVGKGDNIVKV